MNTVIIPNYNEQMFDDDLVNLFGMAVGKTFPTLLAKFLFYSGPFLGSPYLSGACGEGREAEFDQSPLYRTDAFDCVTWVNFMLALLASKNFSDYKQKICQVNYYNAQVRYQSRYHFMSADWNPQNEGANFIDDITPNVVKNFKGVKLNTAKALIDKPNWFLSRNEKDLKLLSKLTLTEVKKRLFAAHNLSKQAAPITATLPYLSLLQLFQHDKDLSKLARQLPGVSIMQVVRPNWDLTKEIGTHLNVSHLGFVWNNGRRLIFRHAALNKAVLDIPLVDYLERYLNSSTIKGVNFHRIVKWL